VKDEACARSIATSEGAKGASSVGRSFCPKFKNPFVVVKLNVFGEKTMEGGIEFASKSELGCGGGLSPTLLRHGLVVERGSENGG
jgi:hypothetical protein